VILCCPSARNRWARPEKPSPTTKHEHLGRKEEWRAPLIYILVVACAFPFGEHFEFSSLLEFLAAYSA
jgi:hypothetical protein